MGKFMFSKTSIEGLYEVTPDVKGDERGYFMESYHYEDFAKEGLDMVFVQDNQSSSRKGVLRGLHFQTRKPQGKLVRVFNGEVFDVAVDLRQGSATFGKWHGTLLSGENKKMLYVPPGFAHGFMVISDYAEFVYKCTDYYDPQGEGGLKWDDEQIGIDWPLEKVREVVLSEKDKKQPSFEDYKKEMGAF